MSRAFRIAVAAWWVVGLSHGELRAACGEELTVDTSLLYDFGISPGDLPWISDSDALGQVEANPNRFEARRLALTRAMLWLPILKYRAVEGGEGVEIPLDGGRWRTARVTHPESGSTYDVVHWDDIDDGSYTAYFRPGLPVLCQLAYEN